MTLSKILLAGVAFGALSAAPAMARQAPAIHFASHGRANAAASVHLKSNIRDPKSTNFTETQTFSGTLSVSADYNKKILLLGDTWYNSNSCTEPTKEKWVGLPKKTKYATVSQSTSTGTISTCPGTTFTFHDIDYKLTVKAKKKNKDTVKGDLVAKNFMGYNLKLIATVDISFSK